MKIKFNVGMRVLLFKIKSLDKQVGKLGQRSFVYKNFLAEVLKALKSGDPLIQAVAKSPVTESYKKFKIKKL
jgi:hypothetical protein